jgi:NADH-quinone oxidoreductase subunit C
MSPGFDESLADLERGGASAGAAGAAAAGDAAGAELPAVRALLERFGPGVVHHEVQAGNEPVVFIRPEQALAILGWLKSDPGQRYDLLQDLTAVEYGGGRPIQVVYQLYSLASRLQLRVKAELPLDALEIDSVAGIWATADWLEREVFDMFGIHFRGHPDLRRILMPDNYAEGHPLRKDFPLRGRFSRAEQTRRALELELEDYYTPVELAIGRHAQGSPPERPAHASETAAGSSAGGEPASAAPNDAARATPGPVESTESAPGRDAAAREGGSA